MHCVRALKASKVRRSHGQAALEYVLLVAAMTGIFGFFFGVIRQNLYRLWVCEFGPRVQAPAGCLKMETGRCFQYAEAEPPPNCSPNAPSQASP